jgi:uncharacterized protein YbcC (UPF0753/DUF2309 family)
MDYLAVRLTMTRVASRMGAAETIPRESPLKTEEKRRLSRAARVYDAARVVSLSAAEVARLSDEEWLAFVSEVKACNGFERRRILHLAYERRHERQILSGIASHKHYRSPERTFSAWGGQEAHPTAQVFFCIDEREESMRRALEEADPKIETFGAAGYFGVAVDYKGIDDPHSAAFCPVVIKPGTCRPRTAESGRQRPAGEAPPPPASARIGDAEFVPVLEDAGRRLALDGRFGVAFGGAAGRTPAGAPSLRTIARVDEQGLPP